MIKETDVFTLEKSDLEKITVENTVFNKNLASHLNKCERIGNALIAEVKKYKDIAKKADIAGNKTVTIENRPSNTFDKDEFIAVYGEAEYKRFCHLKDKLYVTFHG